MITPILIMGTSEDGPVNTVTYTGLDNIKECLNLYGETQAFSTTLLPSGTTVTLPKVPQSYDIEFKYWNPLTQLYTDVYLNSLVLSGSVLSIGPIQSTVPISGWILYKKAYSPSNLIFALKQAESQSIITPLLNNNIGLLRVVPDNSTYSQVNIGNIIFEYIYPGNAGNNYQIVISTTGLSIVPPPNGIRYKTLLNNFESVLTYKFSEYTLSTFIDQLKSDVVSKLSRVRIKLDSKQYVNDSMYTTFASHSGTHVLSGGSVSGNITSKNYYDSLYNVSPSSFDNIVLPGVKGRQFFPYSPYLVNNFSEYPFRIICSTSGTTYTDIHPDIWVSSRLILVHTTGNPNIPYSISTDLSVPYSVILSSESSLYGMGMNQYVSAYNLSTNDSTVKDKPVILISTLNGKSKVIKVSSTDTSSSPTALACARSLVKEVITKLDPLIGSNLANVFPYAEEVVKQAINTVIKYKSPITEATFQLSYLNTELLIDINFRYSGSIETIKTSVSIKG